jgi:phosphate transport system protein
MRPREQYEKELESLQEEIQSLGRMVVTAVTQAIDAFNSQDVRKAEQVITEDNRIDQARDDVEQHVLIIIARQSPVAGDLRRLLGALEVVTELERIGDYAKRIAKATTRQPTPPQNVPTFPIPRMAELTVTMLRDGLSAFMRRDPQAARLLEEADDEIDKLEDQVRSETIAFIKQEPQAAEWTIDRQLVAHTLERMADRVTNIAEQIVFIQSGERVELNH